MKITLTLFAFAVYVFLIQSPAPENRILPESYQYTVAIVPDSVEVERLSPGGGTETMTYTYVSAPAYDSLYKEIFLDSTELIEYNRVHKAKFR